MNSALAAPLALALAVALSLSGCSGDPSEPTAAPASQAPRVVPADEGVISPVDLPADPVFSNKSQGVITDVQVTSCDTDPGDASATGTATNSGDFTRDIVVTIAWTVGTTDDVVAKGIATVEDLAPGESADWEIDTTVPGSTPTACVPTALAGQLKG